MDPNISYKITPFVRKLLAKPIGTLFEGSIEENIPKVKKYFENNSIFNPKIICVGDVVSNAFLSDPELTTWSMLCIVDEKTKRGRFEIDATILDFNRIQLTNPAGLITQSSIQTIKRILTTNIKSIIIVDGEEDLLALPSIIFSPQNSFVLYGQPSITDLDTSIPAGLVMIPVNSSTQKQVQDLLDQFEKV
ncbi:MAG: GTP-dependent dephospho-CoA kinase family protein [Promethearchaeota archaeon]